MCNFFFLDKCVKKFFNTLSGTPEKKLILFLINRSIKSLESSIVYLISSKISFTELIFFSDSLALSYLRIVLAVFTIAKYDDLKS